MPNPEVVTNFNDEYGTDLGKKLISKDYLISVYPQIANQMITPELWIWGYNGYGNLGDNTTTDKSTPVTTLSGGSNWKSVTTGITNSVAIKNDGTLWVLGGNRFGESGTNLAPSGFSPVYITPVQTFAGGTNWKQVSTGAFFCAAIKTDGTLWTWGANPYGGLGTNDTTDRITPVQTLIGGTNWKQVCVGNQNYMTAAIKTDGTLWTWGRNAYGQLGTNNTTNRETPVQTLVGGTNWKQVSTGGSHTVAIKTDGTLWTWGFNSYGGLGTNDTTNRLTPVQVFGNHTNWKQVSGGNNYSAAIKTDGTLWTWGRGTSGELGDNTATNRITPVTTFTGGTNWKQVSGGGNHTAAIKTDGTLWNWGANSNGKLGTNDTTQRLTPVTTFAGGTNWKQVSCNEHTAAIKTSDDLIGI